MPQNPDISEEDILKISVVMHETVRAFQKANGQTPAPPWRQAPKWMRTATRDAILFRIENPDAPSSAQHDQWMRDKTRDGWIYGIIKDADAKTHPLMVPYDELPDVERRKDALVIAVINAMIEPL